MEAVSRSGYPDLCFLTPEKGYPHPPTLWKSFFDSFISCNLHDINSLHFRPVDESVTANPRFSSFFGLFWGKNGSKSAVFDGFLHGQKSRLRQSRNSTASPKQQKRHPKAALSLETSRNGMA
jgi:hypothetical protein